MEEDVELSGLIKMFLTNDIRDDEEKRKQTVVNFEQFYNSYKKEPSKYVKFRGGRSDINLSVSLWKDDEDYIRKDSETSEMMKKLGKKFY